MKRLASTETLSSNPPASAVSKRTRAAVVSLIGLVIGAGVGYLGMRVALAGSTGGAHLLRGYGAAVVALVVPTVFLVILLHELGHVVGGLSQGFRFAFLMIGPLWIDSSRGRLRLGYNRLSASWGGLAACIPVGEADLARRMAVMTAAGPVASLVLALLALAAAVPMRPATPAGALFHLVLLVAGLSSLAIAVATGLMPGGSGGFRSDGTRARALLRGDAAAAGEALDRAVVRFDELPALARPGLAAAAAFFEGAHRGDVAKATAWLSKTSGPMLDLHGLRLAESAVALAAGEPARARERAEAGLAALPKARFGASAADREKLERLRDRAAAA